MVNTGPATCCAGPVFDFMNETNHIYQILTKRSKILYEIAGELNDSPSGSNARGFTLGSIFNQTGELVASVVQEGLIRPVEG